MKSTPDVSHFPPNVSADDWIPEVEELAGKVIAECCAYDHNMRGTPSPGSSTRSKRPIIKPEFLACSRKNKEFQDEKTFWEKQYTWFEENLATNCSTSCIFPFFTKNFSPSSIFDAGSLVQSLPLSGGLVSNTQRGLSDWNKGRMRSSHS